MSTYKDQIEILSAGKSVADFFDDINHFKYNHEFTDISFSRAKKNYERILKRLHELSLPHPLSLAFTSITLEELKDTLRELLIKILGEDYLPILKDIEQMISTKPIENYFDAIVDESIAAETPKVEKIYISKKLYNIQVVSTGHEYIHALLSKYKCKEFNNHITNIHYNELLSVLVEYILCYELSKMTKDQNLIDSHEVIRISHDHEQSKELLAIRSLSADIYHAKGIEASFYKAYSEYQEHNAFTYILADFYSVHLLEFFKDDPTIMNKLIRSILDGEKTLLDLIKYYDISFRNPETLRLYDEQINRTLTYKRPGE